MSDPFFTSKERKNFLSKIQFDTEALVKPPGESLPQFRKSAVQGIPMIFRVADRLAKGLDHKIGAAEVRIPHPQIDDLLSLAKEFPFSPVHLDKEVGRQFFEPLRRFERERFFAHGDGKEGGIITDFETL